MCFSQSFVLLFQTRPPFLIKQTPRSYTWETVVYGNDICCSKKKEVIKVGSASCQDAKFVNALFSLNFPSVKFILRECPHYGAEDWCIFILCTLSLLVLMILYSLDFPVWHLVGDDNLMAMQPSPQGCSLSQHGREGFCLFKSLIPKYQVDFSMVNLISCSDKIKVKITVVISLQYSMYLLTYENPNVHFKVNKLAFMVIKL